MGEAMGRMISLNLSAHCFKTSVLSGNEENNNLRLCIKMQSQIQKKLFQLVNKPIQKIGKAKAFQKSVDH